MNETQKMDISYRAEELSNEYYNELISKWEDIDEDVVVAEQERDRVYRENAVDGVGFDISTISLAVSGTSLLLQLYQIARDDPNFHNFSIRDSQLKIWSDWDLEFHLIHVEHKAVITSTGDEEESDENEKRHLLDTSEVPFPPSENTKEE